MNKNHKRGDAKGLFVNIKEMVQTHWLQVYMNTEKCYYVLGCNKETGFSASRNRQNLKDPSKLLLYSVV